jgi:hypothetical protein
VSASVIWCSFFGFHMAGLSNLDFSSGLAFQRQVKDRFGVPVSPISPSSVFFLVSSFSRSTIKIDPGSVSLILQSCLGGKALDFNVIWLKD